MAPLARRFLGFLVVVAGATYAVLATLHYISVQNANRMTEESLQKAIRLEPSNSDNYYRLAVLEAWALMEPEKSVAHFEKAISLNPNSGEYWLKLALAYRVMGQPEKEHAAVVRALEVEPKSWNVLNDAAMGLFTSGHVADALPLYRLIMQKMPYYSEEYIPMLLRAEDARTVLQEATPKSAEVYSVFIAYLLNKDRDSDAEMVMQRALDDHEVPKRVVVLRLIDELLKNNHSEEALDFWHRLGKADAEWRQYSIEEGMVNGGFEVPLLRGGFDWRFEESAGMKADLSRESPALGESALKVSFDRHSTGSNLLWIYLPVQPSATYELQFRFRTSALSSASMPRIAVEDCSGKVIYLSEPLQDASAWSQMHGGFTIPEKCKLARILLNRDDPEKLIAGELSLDDFRIN